MYKRGGWVRFWVFYSAQQGTDFGQLYSNSEIVYNVKRRYRMILINERFKTLTTSQMIFLP